MPLGTEVGLCPSDVVLDGDPAPPQKGAQQTPHFLAHVYCGQTAGWIRIPLGTEVSLGPGGIVLDGDPALLTERGTAAATFRHMSILVKRSPISVIAMLLPCTSSFPSPDVSIVN